MDVEIGDIFAVEALDGLSEYLVGLPVIGMLFMPDFLPNLHFAFSTVRTANFRVSAYREFKEGPVSF